MYQHFVKRVLDFLAASAGILVLFPLLVGICIAIKLDSKGPVLFKQKRVGKNKTYFQIWKFRSMYITAPQEMPTHLLQGASSHITKVGAFLRKTSLDELPQLWNIWRGDMALIGPRPALWNQEDLIRERDLYDANSVRPGLTGWAQVNGRDTISIEDKARLDGEYVRRMSFVFDCKCIWKTLRSVLTSEGVKEGK